MGRGAAAVWHSRECDFAGGSDDAAVPGMAEQISESGRKARKDCEENSTGQAHDGAGGDRRDRVVPDIRAGRAYKRATHFGGRWLRTPKSRADVECAP